MCTSSPYCSFLYHAIAVDINIKFFRLFWNCLLPILISSNYLPHRSVVPNTVKSLPVHVSLLHNFVSVHPDSKWDCMKICHLSGRLCLSKICCSAPTTKLAQLVTYTDEVVWEAAITAFSHYRLYSTICWLSTSSTPHLIPKPWQTRLRWAEALDMLIPVMKQHKDDLIDSQREECTQSKLVLLSLQRDESPNHFWTLIYIKVGRPGRQPGCCAIHCQLFNECWVKSNTQSRLQWHTHQAWR